MGWEIDPCGAMWAEGRPVTDLSTSSYLYEEMVTIQTQVVMHTTVRHVQHHIKKLLSKNRRRKRKRKEKRKKKSA